MATKSTKDKTLNPAPRFTPRPTAASTARAARNATNRNINVADAHKSPSRSSHSPASSVKAKERSVLNKDSKNENKDFKIISVENGGSTVTDSIVTNDAFPRQETESMGIGKDSVLVLEGSSNQDLCDNNEEILQDNIKNEPRNPASRPQTPVATSRPQTPKTSSRPVTPRIRSRPTTPGQKHNTLSRPVTPQRNSVQPHGRVPSRPPSVCSDRPVTPVNTNDIKAVYEHKRNLFHDLKKELDLKQQTVLQLVDSLKGLKEQMDREGLPCHGDGQPQQELVVLNVGDWTTEEVTRLCRQTSDISANEVGESINTLAPIDESTLSNMKTKMSEVQSKFANLCLQAFTARQEVIDWVKELIQSNENGGGEFDRISQFNNQGLEFCEILRNLKTYADETVEETSTFTKRICHERSALVGIGESLVREITKLRGDIEYQTAQLNELKTHRPTSEIEKSLEATRRELEQEQAAKGTNKDKLAATEAQLRQARARITKMDRQLREAEASIASLTGTVKSLEDQSRQREVQLESRARKLRESLKTGEVTSSQLTQHRDELLYEVQCLKEQITTMVDKHKSEVQSLNQQLKKMKSELESERQINERESLLKQELEAKIAEFEKNQTNPDLPSEREMELWAELQATKETLKLSEEEVASCKREKICFLETLTKIAETDNKVGMQQKLAAELMSKEEILSKMQTQIREMSKTIKFNEQKLMKYEQYVRDLQAHNRAVANGQENADGIVYTDLQQELMDLRMNLLDAAHRNEELSEQLAQKEHQLEQQDKTSRTQARVIKVNHQIAAKANEIQELFATLESKQQQIHRLEKIVLALEEQQRRSQAQRTRHEEKIAALEHELAGGVNRRDRKYLFF